MSVNIEISDIFPASHIGKPCYVGLLTKRDGSELRIGRTRPAFSYIADLISGEIINSEQIFFEEFHAAANQQYAVTHVALYDDPFCGVAFAAAKLAHEINISDGVVAAFCAGAVKLILAGEF